MNKVILMGFVGVKPERRSERVVSFRLATHKRGYTRSDGTIVPEVTMWHSITIFDQKVGDFVISHVGQGASLIVEGEIRYSLYTDKDGIERQGVEIVASSVSFPSLGVRKEKSESGQNAETPPSIKEVTADLPF